MLARIPKPRIMAGFHSSDLLAIGAVPCAHLLHLLACAAAPVSSSRNHVLMIVSLRAVECN